MKPGTCLLALAGLAAFCRRRPCPPRAGATCPPPRNG
ncbi:MprA protease, GlyGly-CTERM protein-sorting domain-containing form [Streptomyces sp. NPDC019826]